MTKRKRRPKLTLEDVREYFEHRGCTLLTKRYIGSKQRLCYRCNKCGRLGYVCMNNFTRSTGCRNCYFEKSRSSQKTKKILLRQQLLTISDVAKLLGVEYDDLWHHVRIKETLPAPSVKCGVRRYYTERDVEKIRKLIVLVGDKDV